MRKEQDKIINELSYKHGISVGHAKEIWKLFTNKVQEEISAQDKKEEGLFVKDKFKTIHIHNFGKFIPDKRKIHYANLCLKKKKDD